ncbi:lanthionine synthetase C family protein [Parabacteroides pacaensis]|uniref:lanthionine synthetase C family protein n=1 Tax=Parabacteroides pacaensis TaxID=2086575 RepID=UPI000D0FB8FD|nr:lanthionine synthetase C family protein [Parabacteroides pacaensis]
MGISSSKYMQIIENIHEELMTCELSENIGLHAGTSGIALFFAYYSRIILKKNNISPRVMEILEHNIECIDSGKHLHTICDGISGFGWLCEHLRKLGMLTKRDITFLDDLDPFLYKMMMIDIKQGNYDYLHGALGVGIYLLSRLDKKYVFLYLDDLLTELEKSAIECENGATKWISVLTHETGEKGYNISLSHGMSSIAAFFIRLYRLNYETNRVKKLLIKTITYILDQITYVEGNISYFPLFSKENSKSSFSRLGWCYGDLGIAHVLLQSAIILKNQEWRNIALQILHHNSNRRNLQENRIWSTGLCHGSSGIAYIYLNLYMYTLDRKFVKTSDFWINVTKNNIKYDCGILKFRVLDTDRFEKMRSSYTLLDGISGIGLSFLSHLKNDENDWSESLLLSLC